MHDFELLCHRDPSAANRNPRNSTSVFAAGTGLPQAVRDAIFFTVESAREDWRTPKRFAPFASCRTTRQRLGVPRKLSEPLLPFIRMNRCFDHEKPGD
jgi:hypothetical protein